MTGTPRDGDGWTVCELGHRHWGLHGAAGLLVVAPGPYVLLQHRATWSHHGDTWGIPGGARGSAESAQDAALREAAEETGLRALDLVVRGERVDDHGGWAYTTVLAQAAARLPVHPHDGESIALEWVALGEVAGRVLHPGFAAGWPRHLDELAR
ncbi:MAG TPA: NUDIX hydrolase [Mycobacteriales bacterium]|nr:NUDIX hydrolase [Mycobacteriales bacterium]